MRTNINKKKLFVIIDGVMFLLLLLFLAFVIYRVNDGSAKFFGGVIMIKLPPENVIFKHELQSHDIKLQDHKVIISKNYIDKFWSDASNKNDNSTSGLLLCKKYTFYENTIFRRIELGHFEILQRHSRKSIHDFIRSDDVDNIYFDIVDLSDYFHISFLPRNSNRITITYNNKKSIEVICRALTCRYSKLSYEITILVGTYETSNKFTEKRHVFPYYNAVNLPIKKL
ncbi:MAG: hypothetical protein LBQ66_16565 [Planctomycetaceae bacterium]|nr:hypothetical protein [Planctomycetaceae bacterium]